MNGCLFVRAKLAIGMVVITLSTLCASDAVGQTLLSPYYPRPTDASTPAAIRPVVAYRKYLAQGLNPEVAAERSFGYASRDLPYAGSLDLLFLRSEGDGSRNGQCAFIDSPVTLWSGLIAPRPTLWVEQPTCRDSGVPPPRGRTWEFADTFEFKAPVRRQAWDGGVFDASPMVQKRNGEGWLTMFWAYRLGLVESQIDWDAARLRTLAAFAGWPRYAGKDEEFVLTALPAPYIEDEVVEYVNQLDFPAQPRGQFFYAVRSFDKTTLDALPRWTRTGKSFLSGGYVSVCRLYGGNKGGPNTHFYSADNMECDALRNVPTLSYEGQTFAVNLPLPPKTVAQQAPGALRDCPTASQPLFRVYNNAANSGGRFASNHRYLTERADVMAAVAQGWVDEGHVMCVPVPPFRP
jgi:hypothetical protein